MKTNTTADPVSTHCAHDAMVDITELIANPRNPNKHGDKQVALLAKIIRHQGWRAPIVVSNRSGFIVTGHGRLEAAKLLGVQTVPVNRQDFATAADEWAHLIADNRIAELAEVHDGELAGLLKELEASGADMLLTGFDEQSMQELLSSTLEQGQQDAEPQLDKAEELRVKWGVETGQLWRLGDHRLLCGDSTKPEEVARLMSGEKAQMVHADPPYGMGKEKEGVENDNLYGGKLDAFQMSWWRAIRPHIEDNSSAYIWGNAAELWRLWYRGGLADSERLTFRNEIVWAKESAGKMQTQATVRCFPPRTERCLFFMLGEQGFNSNADNYWEGWEGIRSALEADCKKMGWGAKDIERICGVKMYSHWFTRSQWTFIPLEHYRKLQAAARDHDAFKRDHDAFKRDHADLKRDHDDLKRDFYDARSRFDNTHDNMTDVWEFPRVRGEERHGHATPKPVEMIKRVMLSSLPVGGICIEPFSGSGSTLMGAENTGRKCRAIEISPAYVAVAIQRWASATGKTPEKI